MNEFEKRYIEARRAVIAQDLKRLNPMQRKAAMTTEGPLLLLAGAGSGKTTVLIQRVYNLLTYGRGSDSTEVPHWAEAEDLDFLERFPRQPDEADWAQARRLCAVDVPRPWEIIAITFLTTLVIGVIFGIYPALKAASKNPIESLKHYR